MTPEAEALGRRAVACAKWRWMPGMLMEGDRVCQVFHDRILVYHGDGMGIVEWWRPGRRDLPDLTDAATLGCVLALVREAWGDPWMVASVRKDTQRWEVWDLRIGAPHPVGDGTTEAEALVSALEAAP